LIDHRREPGWSFARSHLNGAKTSGEATEASSAWNPSKRDIDLVAPEIAVSLVDDVAQVNANPKLDAPGCTPALRSSMPVCTSMAQRMASTALRNSTMIPSPVHVTMRP
jgi:hypothetical protein